MKKSTLHLLLTAGLLLGACGGKNSDDSAQKKTITCKGSDTVLPLAQKAAENFMKTDSLTTVSVVGGGSGVGISALIDGQTDIAMASRDLKVDEKTKLQSKKIDVQETIIAYDALSVIVNPANKVTQLTREQLEDIFTGKITNWKAVGGDDENIVVYSRESSSGTYEFFKEHVMEKKNYATSVMSMPATGAIVTSVGQTKGAIGYIGLAYDTKDVKMLSVSYDQGKTYVAPSVAAAKDKSYPISRPLYFFYDKTKSDLVKPFVDYMLSDAGQKEVAEVGYVPLR